MKYSFCWPDFYLYTKKAPEGFDLNKNLSLNESTFDRTKNTVFIVHGFQSTSFDHGTVEATRNKLVETTDSNVITVDWTEGAGNVKKGIIDLLQNAINSMIYVQCAPNTRIVGSGIARFAFLNNIEPSTVHCIGISLGAHACGFAGKLMPNLMRITGLDPAGPVFKAVNATDRLDKSDAKFVDCILTSKVFGIADPICQKNFYVNGGVKQPKCPPDITLESGFNFCNHCRSFEYFLESIDPSCVFKAVPCDSYNNYKNGKCKCSGEECSPMGYPAYQNTKPGVFFVDTNLNSPYCKKERS